MRKFLIIVLIAGLATGLVLLFFFLTSGMDVQKVTQKGPVIFFGDSLTVGYGAAAEQDFPSLVTKKLNITSAINAGVSGNTTQDALNRLQKDVLDLKPSLVIVEFSGNDFLQNVPAAKTMSNLEEIAQKIHVTGSALVMIEFRFPFSTQTYTDGFTKIAKTYKAAIVWNVLDEITNKKNLMYDNIHPNAAGYKIMADRIAKTIKPLLTNP